MRMMYSKIKKIEKSEKEIEVYNFQCEPENVYWANDILVHNCIDQYQKWCPRSANLIVDELEYLVNKRGVKRISFFDNTFEINPDWCMEIADEIYKRNLKFKWYINSRSDRIVKGGVELFKELRKVGLDGSSIGIEFGSDEILKESHKDTTSYDNYRSIEILKKCDVKSYCSTMIGYLNETKEQMMETVEFLEKSKPTGFQINPVTVYEGTDLWNSAMLQEKVPSDVNWRGISCVPTDVIDIQLSELTVKELIEFRKEIYKRLYTGGWLIRSAIRVATRPSDWKIGFGYFLSMIGRSVGGYKFSH